MHTSAKFKDALTKFAVLILRRAADRVKNGPRKCETFFEQKDGSRSSGARTHAPRSHCECAGGHITAWHTRI